MRRDDPERALYWGAMNDRAVGMLLEAKAAQRKIAARERLVAENGLAMLECGELTPEETEAFWRKVEAKQRERRILTPYDPDDSGQEAMTQGGERAHVSALPRQGRATPMRTGI
jgi:hypothetical protein